MAIPLVNTYHGKTLLSTVVSVWLPDSSSAYKMYIYYFIKKQNKNLVIITYLFTMGLDYKWVSQVVLTRVKVFNGKLWLGSFLVQQNI